MAEKKYYPLYGQGDWSVGVRKPGKEAADDQKRRKADGTKTNNPNDMLPTLMLSGDPHPHDYSFQDIFGMMERMKRADMVALDLLGTLFFRQGLMLDHAESAGRVRLTPPPTALEVLENRLPLIDGLPISSIIYLMEALALNEDVKYFTLEYQVFTQGYGRRNNLHTYVHLIAVLLNKCPLFKFAGSFARPPVGISSITQKDALEAFPYLRGEVPQDLT